MNKAMNKILLAILLTMSFNTYSNTDYDIEVKEAFVKLEYHKARLNDYQNNSQYYGRTGQDVESHTKANIRYYENLIKEHQSKSNLH
jgi:hypothetical protein